MEPAVEQENRAETAPDDRESETETGSADRSHVLCEVQGQPDDSRRSLTEVTTADESETDGNGDGPSDKIMIQDEYGDFEYTVSNNLCNLCLEQGRITPLKIYSGLLCCSWCNPK